MLHRPLTVRFLQAGKPERQTARQKRQNYVPQNMGEGSGEEARSAPLS